MSTNVLDAMIQAIRVTVPEIDNIISLEDWRQVEERRAARVAKFRRYADGEHDAKLTTQMAKMLRVNVNDTANLDYTRTGTNLDDLGWSEVGMISGADYNIDIGIDQGTVATPATPTFAGIVDLVAVGGRLRATWSAGGGTITGYRVFIRNGSSTNLFTSTYFMAEVDNGVTEYIFTTEADGATLLQSTSTYYVGVRADNDGSEDSNTVSLSASADGDGAVPLTINDRKLGVNM